MIDLLSFFFFLWFLALIPRFRLRKYYKNLVRFLFPHASLTEKIREGQKKKGYSSMNLPSYENPVARDSEKKSMCTRSLCFVGMVIY